MRKLHFVGFTTDRQGLIFSGRKGSKTGGFLVPLEKKLLDTIAEAQRANGDDTPAQLDGAQPSDDKRGRRGESALTPREMQARLRAGRTIEEVAAEANVDSEWVGRFAIPILAEQAKVVELARGLVYSKPRLGESRQPLAESVAWNLADRGSYLPPDVFDAGWSAYQLHDSVWMVRFRYQSRNRQHEAAWELDVPSGRLTARDRLASELGFAENSRRRRAVRPAVPDDGTDEPPTGSGAVRARNRAGSSKPAAKAIGARSGRPRTTVEGSKSPRPASHSGTSGKAARAGTSTGRAPAGKPAGRKATAKASPPRGKRSPGPEPGAAEAGTSAAVDADAEESARSRTAGVRQAVARVTAARLADTRANGPRLTLQVVDGPSRRGAGPSVRSGGRALPYHEPVPSSAQPSPNGRRRAATGIPSHVPHQDSQEQTVAPAPAPSASSAAPSTPLAPPAEPLKAPAGAPYDVAAGSPPEPSSPAEPSPAAPGVRKSGGGDPPSGSSRPGASSAAKPAPPPSPPVGHHDQDEEEWLGLTEDLDDSGAVNAFTPRPLPGPQPAAPRAEPARPSAGSQRRPTISAGRVGGEASFPSPQRVPPPPKVGAPPLKPLNERARPRLRLGRRRGS